MFTEHLHHLSIENRYDTMGETIGVDPRSPLYGRGAIPDRRFVVYMGRPSISEQRRIEIGRALQVCMVRNGSYEATSIKDIAQQAGLATGLVHHYFTGKDEILLLMAENSLLSAANLLDDMLRTRDPEERMEKLDELLADEEQNRFMLMLYSLSLSMPEIRQLILDKHHELEEGLAARLRRSRTFSGDPKQKAYELMFLLENAVIQAALMDRGELKVLLENALQRVFPIAERE